jgi:cysteine-S-conjugate beta-lyase
MKVEGVPLAILRTRLSEKWSGFAPDILPLPVAEMDFELAQPIRDLLVSMVLNSDTGYMGKTDSLNRAFADFASDRWNWIVDTEQFFLCTDVGVGTVEMARTIVQPGDKVLVNSPVYLNMYNWAKELKCQIVDAPMRKDGMSYSLDLAAIEAGYKQGVKIHFLCNPQNPTGTVHTRSELEAIADLASQYGVYVFSDEIHGPIVFDEATFIPFLSVSDNARQVGVCVTAASKAWNLAGLKCAFIITESERISALAKSMPPSVRFRASLFGAHAAAKAFESTEWLDAMMETLDRNRQFLQVQLENKLPKAKYQVPSCTYLAWIDMSAYDLGENPAKAILEGGKVALTPGYLFGPDCSQFIRLNFATSEEIIAEGIDRIVAAIKVLHPSI